MLAPIRRLFRLAVILAGVPVFASALPVLAQTEDPGPTCGEYPSPTEIRLGWVEPGTGIARPRDGKATLQLDNAAAVPRVVDLVSVADLDGRRVRTPIGTWTLPARASQKVRIGIPASAAEVRALRSSGRLYVSSTVRNAAGTVLESPHAVPVYFHPDMDGVIVLYPREVMMARFAGGNFRGLEAGARRPRGRTQYVSAGLPQAEVDDFGLGRGRTADVPTPGENTPPWLEDLIVLEGNGGDIDDLAPSLVKLCFTLPAHVDDQPFGDLGHEESWWAVGLRYAVYAQGTDTLLAEGFLPRNPPMCFWWSIQSEPITVDTWLESEVGGTGRTFHVATFENQNSAYNWADGNDNPITSASTMISPGLYSGGSQHTFEIDYDVRLATGHATVVNGLQRIEQLTKRDEVVDRRIAAFVDPGGAWADVEVLKLTDDDNRKRKYVYLHEVGHIVHQHFRGQAPGAPTSYLWVDEPSPGDDNCPGANDTNELPGEHAMRSLERSAEAYGEGIAHFLAAVTLSLLPPTNETEFKYYKQSDVYGYDFDLISLKPSTDTDVLGGTPNYLHNVCGCIGSLGQAGPLDDEDWPCEQVGVELDWLRFYWAYYRAEPEGPRPSLVHILEQAGNYVYGTGNAFDQLLADVQPEFEERMRCMGCDFGVGGCQLVCE